jgi:hypothetical protein
MALTYDDMDAAVKKKFLPKAIEQIFIGNPLYTKLIENCPAGDLRKAGWWLLLWDGHV